MSPTNSRQDFWRATFSDDLLGFCVANTVSSKVAVMSIVLRSVFYSEDCLCPVVTDYSRCYGEWFVGSTVIVEIEDVFYPELLCRSPMLGLSVLWMVIVPSFTSMGMNQKIEREHCFEFNNIPKDCGWPDSPLFGNLLSP